jgi:periplasmic protein CpxP/Spy
MMLHLTSRISSAFAAASIFGAVLIVLPSAAMAQASPVPAPAAKAAPAHSSRVEARIKSLHDALHITAAQEPQWQAVADVMRDNAKTIGTLIQARAAKAKAMNAVEDLHSYEAIADAHAAGVKKLAAAFETLYASLSDAQKKDADAVFRRRPHALRPKKSG